MKSSLLFERLSLSEESEYLLFLLFVFYCVAGILNDLWKFNGTHWTWISGSNVIDQFGVYGGQGIPSSSNIPGARYLAESWIDSNNFLWLFGGVGNGVNGSYGK